MAHSSPAMNANIEVAPWWPDPATVTAAAHEHPGLNSTQAAAQLERYGANVFRPDPHHTLLRGFDT